MDKKKIGTYAFFILLAETVGALAGVLTRSGVEAYDSLNKASGTPPSIVFPIVWSMLYLLMGVGVARVYLSLYKEKDMPSTLFFIQLAVNFLWPFIFFNQQAFGLAFFWLIFLLVLVLLMTVHFRKADQIAALLQIPYLLWLIYAAYLNLGAWILNT